jgi:hypothetical protein
MIPLSQRNPPRRDSESTISIGAVSSAHERGERIDSVLCSCLLLLILTSIVLLVVLIVTLQAHEQEIAKLLADRPFVVTHYDSENCTIPLALP